jgi:predicted PurR-regulated permease PerM
MAERRLVSFDVPAAMLLKIGVAILLLVLAGEVLSQIRDALVLVVTSLFLAVALNPLVQRLERRLSRRLSVLAVFLGFVLLLVVVATALVAPFASQVDDIAATLPADIRDAAEEEPLATLNERFDIVDRADRIAERLPEYAFGEAETVLGGAVATVTILFLTLFLLFDLPAIGEVALRQLRPRSRARARHLAGVLNRTIAGYVAGNLLISLICGTVTLITLLVLGVPYALTLAAFVAIFDLVPLVGATVGAVTVVAVTLVSTGGPEAAIVAVVMIVYQQVENHLLQPLVYGRTVELSGLGVLLAVLVGSALLGLLGALLAIPIGAAIQVVARDLLDARADRLEAEEGVQPAR